MSICTTLKRTLGKQHKTAINWQSRYYGTEFNDRYIRHVANAGQSIIYVTCAVLAAVTTNIWAAGPLSLVGTRYVHLQRTVLPYTVLFIRLGYYYVGKKYTTHSKERKKLYHDVIFEKNTRQIT